MLALLFAVVTAPALAADDTAALYQKHCASCHGVDRLGGMGPALLPENLGRLRKGEASKVIAEGRAATPGLFRCRLSRSGTLTLDGGRKPG